MRRATSLRGGDGERRVGLEDRDVALAEQGRQALARPGVQEVDRTEVALGLELLQVLEEEGDLVVEARHRLEREPEDLLAGRGAELLEADGLLADAPEERRREDRVGIEGQDAVGEKVGELVAQLLEVIVPLAVDGLGVVDDEDRVAEVIGHGHEAVGEEQGEGREARAEFAALDGGDLGVEVAGDASGALAGGGLPAVQEFGRGRELAEAGDGQPLDPAGASAGWRCRTRGARRRASRRTRCGRDWPPRARRRRRCRRARRTRRERR